MNGTGISFFNAAPIAQVADVLAAPAGGTGLAAGGYDTAANRDLMIATVNGMRDAFRNLGLMA
jgi:molybdopterin biosynthesis enzyme MoaB